MAEEEIVDTSATETKEDVPAAEPVVEPTAETPETPDVPSDSIDYEGDLAREQERGKPDPEAAKQSFKEREAKREEPKESEDDKPLTRREAREFLERQTQEIQKVSQAQRIREMAKSMSQSDAEANLIVEIHKNRSFPANLSLEEQVEEAHAIANRKKIQKQSFELARALRSRETASKDLGSTVHDSPQGSVPKITSAEAQALKDSGLVWDGIKRVYKKPIGNGKKFYYFDPKSRKRWTA